MSNEFNDYWDELVGKYRQWKELIHRLERIEKEIMRVEAIPLPEPEIQSIVMEVIKQCSVSAQQTALEEAVIAAVFEWNKAAIEWSEAFVPGSDHQRYQAAIDGLKTAMADLQKDILKHDQ